MLIYIIIFIIALGIGGFICWLFLKGSLLATKQYDEAMAEFNKQLEERNKQLQEKAQRTTEILNDLYGKEQLYTGKISALENSIKVAEKQAKEASDKFYEQNMQVAIEHLNQSIEKETKNYNETIQFFKTSLEEIQQEETQQLNEKLKERQQEIEQKQNILNELQAKVNAAVAASKRQEEIKEEKNFYRIQLSDLDTEEIEKLRSVEPYLRDKEPLNKIIWKVYYEKPTNDLIGRVIGSGIHTGIYKITHIESNKCYVGQAADLTTRWKQHIKRGIGAETPTRNKLYPAMIKYGPENFTFEVIEECDRTLLDEREDYWQDYFKAKEFGYSIK